MSGTFFSGKIYQKPSWQSIKSIQVLGIGYFRRYYWSLAGEKKRLFHVQGQTGS